VIQVRQLLMIVGECNRCRPVLSLKAVDFAAMKYYNILNTIAAVHVFTVTSTSITAARVIQSNERMTCYVVGN
jgi:hypothetical protein